MKKISVLVVDDSALIRKLFSDMLNAEADIEVVATATDPYDAREKIRALAPQVVTLDIEMPKMDGLSFLERIMKLRPMPVIMASTLTQRGAMETLRALEIGAVDYISKPLFNGTPTVFESVRRELAEKVRTAAQANLRHAAQTNLQARPATLADVPRGATDVIAIGSSTGGVEALRHIFTALPDRMPPIVVAQHMPAQFTPSFAARLDSLTAFHVREARHGDLLSLGTAYIAPGGRHLSLRRDGGDLYCNLTDGDTVSGHKPSVDVLFSSVAAVAGKRALGVILTGMGRDGAAGMAEMHAAGSYNIAQNKASCVVYGMPGSAVAQGGVHAEIALPDIAAHMIQRCAIG